MFRKIIIVIPFFFCVNNLIYSQERKDLGLQTGGTYYMGDYNIETPLYQPSPGIGIIFRYNLNKYYAFRMSAYYGGLKGNFSSTDFYLPGVTGSFSKKLIEANGLCEINFMSFNTKHLRKDNFSPYLVLGVGVTYIGGDIIPSLPFGMGVKYCPVSRITVGCEWKLSKTVFDGIDNYQNIYDGSKATLHNNDWFSFIGIFVTFRLYNYNNTCPVYQ